MPIKKSNRETLNIVLTIKQDDMVRGIGIKNNALIKQIKQKQRIIDELKQDNAELYQKKFNLQNEKKQLIKEIEVLKEKINTTKSFRLSIIEKKELIIDNLLEEISKFDKKKAEELNAKYKDLVKVYSHKGTEVVEIKDSFKIKERNNGRTGY